MRQIVPFDFQGHAVRIQIDEQGNPRWLLNECTQVIGIKNITDAAKRLDPEDLEKIEVLDARGVAHETWLINESGLYTLLLRSSRPEAKAFRRWVTSEVLPTIRKTGSFHGQSATSLVLDAYPELKALRLQAEQTVQLVEGLAQTRIKADAAELQARQAEQKANLAIQQQQWLTIREYVYLHKLSRQCPEQLWPEFGRYLTGYCLEKGIPVRGQPVGDRRYPSEHAYHVEVIHLLLDPWIRRHQGQAPLTILHER